MRKPKSSRPRLVDNAASNNVVRLSSFRDRRPAPDKHTVYYLNDWGTWLDTLCSLPSVRVEDIVSAELLKTKLLTKAPDLILLESGIEWADPVATIELLGQLVEAPIVMICGKEAGASVDAELIKRAYAAGVQDTLYPPLRHDDVLETLDVLLKFRRHVSLHQ